MNAPASPLLDVTEAAGYLRKSKAWLYRNADKIGCVRDGGPLRFRQVRLDEWIARHETRLTVVPTRQATRTDSRLDPTRINPFTQRPYGEVAR